VTFFSFPMFFFFNFLVFRCFFLKFGKKTFSKPFCFEDIVHDDEVLDLVLRKKKNKKRNKIKMKQKRNKKSLNLIFFSSKKHFFHFVIHSSSPFKFCIVSLNQRACLKNGSFKIELLFYLTFWHPRMKKKKTPGKLACLSLTNTFTLACYFLSKSAAYPSRAPFKAPLPSVHHELNKIGCKFITTAITLAYYSTVIITAVKSFVIPAPEFSTRFYASFIF